MNIDYSFTYYDEDNDKIYTLTLSDGIIKCIKIRGWTITKKIGEGGEKVVFEVVDNNNNYAAVLIPSNNCDPPQKSNLANIRKLQKQKPKLLEYTIEVYTPLVCHNKISNDDIYCPHNIDKKIIIEVVQLADYTLADHIIKMYNTGTLEQKVYLAVYVFNKLNEMNLYLNSLGLQYNDLLFDNIGLIGSRMVFIDLDSISELEEDWTNSKCWNFVKDMFNIYQPNTDNDKTLKWVTGMSRNEEEKIKGLQLFNNKIKIFYIYLIII